MAENIDIRTKTLNFLKEKRIIKTAELAAFLDVSRQYASKILQILSNSNEILKIGSTKSAQYTLLEFSDEIGLQKNIRHLKNQDLKEHEVMENFLSVFPAFRIAPENIQSILRYAFSEMLNNAIEHSISENIELQIIDDGQNIKFIISDKGIGVFRNIMNKRGLKSETEAVQDLLKGKTTTAPEAHSGEGIFFTSKMADKFSLESFGFILTINNLIDDVFFGEKKPIRKGTRVVFSIDKKSKRHLSDIFKKFQSNPEEYAFDKTEIRVRLFTMGTIYISRSQARRVLYGLEKFKSIVFDFNKVSSVGQAFADEIFRVFKSKHPEILLESINTNEAVRFMVERVGKVE